MSHFVYGTAHCAVIKDVNKKVLENFIEDTVIFRINDSKSQLRAQEIASRMGAVDVAMEVQGLLLSEFADKFQIDLN